MKKYYPEQYFKRAGYKFETTSSNNNAPLKKNAATASLLDKSRNTHITKDFVRFNEELDSIHQRAYNTQFDKTSTYSSVKPQQPLMKKQLD